MIQRAERPRLPLTPFFPVLLFAAAMLVVALALGVMTGPGEDVWRNLARAEPAPSVLEAAAAEALLESPVVSVDFLAARAGATREQVGQALGARLTEADGALFLIRR